MNALIIKMRHEKAEEDSAKLRGVTIDKTKYDEDSFDERVAESISGSLSYIRYKKKNDEYKRWCYANLDELKNMYSVSELNCDFNDFCSYVFCTKK